MTGPFLVHGVALRDAAPAPGAPAHLRAPMGRLAILLSPSGLTGDAAADTAEALRHNAILVAMARAGGVIPVRFGMAASSPEAAVEAFAAEADRLAEALARLDGRVEYLARLSAAPDAAAQDGVETPRPAAAAPDGAPVDAPDRRAAVAPGAGGGDWLRAKSVSRRRREAARDQQRGHAQAVADKLAAVADLRRAERPRRQGVLLELALLCRPGAGEAALRQAARDAAETSPGLHLELSGPWPPYASLESLTGAPA